MQLRLLHITDCHLVPDGERLLDMDTSASLTRVLEQAFGAKRWDAIVASGDLVHSGGPKVYEKFWAIVSSFADAPLLCLPGNHDELLAMRQAQLPMQPLELDIWQIAPLDSHGSGVPEAEVGEQDLMLLEQYRRASMAQHGLLATHHPLCETATPWLDKVRIADPEKVLDVIAATPGPTLRGAIFGHAHQEISAHHGTLKLLGTPSTCFQFKPGSQGFSLDRLAPGYRGINLYEDGRVSSRVYRLSDWTDDA